MSTVLRPAVDLQPPLQDGERLTRGEFLRRWEAMPELKHAERIEGVVEIMASPTAADEHAEPHGLLASLLGNYRLATPGIAFYVEPTLLLDLDNEFNPDLALLIRPEFGGQTHRIGKFIAEAPELVAEIAHTSIGRDRNRKLPVYRRNGVREYLIWMTEARVFECYFNTDDGDFELQSFDQGVWKSRVFPGLWIHVDSLLAGDLQAVKSVADAGLASPEHVAFAAELAAKAPPTA